MSDLARLHNRTGSFEHEPSLVAYVIRTQIHVWLIYEGLDVGSENRFSLNFGYLNC